MAAKSLSGIQIFFIATEQTLPACSWESGELHIKEYAGPSSMQCEKPNLFSLNIRSSLILTERNSTYANSSYQEAW